MITRTKWGNIKTRFPDMSRIIASSELRKCRNLFKEAVAYKNSDRRHRKEKSLAKKGKKKRRVQGGCKILYEKR